MTDNRFYLKYTNSKARTNCPGLAVLKIEYLLESIKVMLLIKALALG